MNFLDKNIISSYIAQIISVICGFLSSILLARMLGTDGQGELSLYLNFIVFASIVLGFGLGSGISHFIASRSISKSVIGTIILLVGSLGVLVILCILAVFGTTSFYLPSIFNEKQIWLIVLFAHLFFIVVNQFLVAILQGENHFQKAALVSSFGSILLLIFYILIYFGMVSKVHANLSWVILSLVLVQIAQWFYYIVLIRKVDSTYFQLAKIDFKTLQPLIQFSSLAFIANVVQFLSYKVDVWFIKAIHHSSEMVGIYSLGVTLVQLILLLPSTVHSVLYTEISTQGNTDEMVLKVKSTFKKLLLLSTIVGVAGFLGSIYFLPLWFGEAFSDSVSIIGILLFGIIPLSGAFAFSAYFAGIRKVGINMNGSIIGLVVCLVLNYLLIPKYGIQGAAIASVISYCTTSGYYYYKFYSYTKLVKS